MRSGALLAAPLVPYKTVGVFMFLIMLASSVATLLILPAIITMLKKVIFDESETPACKCSYCMLFGFIVAAAVAYVLGGYSMASWNVTTVICVLIIAGFAGMCNIVSKGAVCNGKNGRRGS